MLAVGQRNARIGGHCRCRSHAGDDLEGYAVVHQVLGLLPSPAEDEGVPRLSARYDPSLFGLPDEGVDVLLRKGVSAPLLAHVDKLGIGPAVVEDPFVGEVVVDDDVGLLHPLQALDGDQPRITGPRADQVYFSD